MTAASRPEAEGVWALPKEKAGAWVERLMGAAQVIAPVRGPEGEEVYDALEKAEDILWDFVNPLDPPKRFVLPQTEPLARIEKSDGRFRVEPLYDEGPRVLLNLRNCDLKGFHYLRRMHAADLPDPSFLRRFESFTLVSLACTRPCPWGFCICCEAGPFLREGYDLQLTDLGEVFLAEVGSAKGRKALEAGGEYFRPATEAEQARRLELEQQALRSFGPETCHFGSAMRRISTRRVADELWEAMGPWCLECGGCNLACPTCYCFSVKDRSEEGWRGQAGGDGGPQQVWTRCRIWDSCQYQAFTLEASGHNPREAKRERIKRRFYHKVSAQYYHKDQALGCVGCGRCILVCMGTTDMPSVVAAIRKGRWEGGRL